MKFIENKLYLSFSDMLESGIKEDTVKKAVLRGTITTIADPADKRCVLVEYATLRENYKKQVEAHFGNPYEYIVKEPIKKMVAKDFKAEAFFHAHTICDGKKLPIDNINKYTNEAAWLNMLLEVSENPKKYKQALNLDILPFFTQVESLLQVEKAAGRLSSNFPTSYSKLRAKMAVYKTEGYASLIDKRFGNASAAKVNDEVSEAVLKEMIGHSNQYDFAFIAHQYNIWAAANGYKEITRGTVQNKAQEWKLLLQVSREGKEEYNAESRQKVKRERPSYPLALVESDDNHLDWWFQGDKAGDYKRIKAIMVVDSYNDYVLGYAITDGEMQGTELVRLAYLNAIHHIHELTGGWYRPYQVLTDQWNIEQLRPFYQKMAHYHDTPVGSKGRGWIEQFFGTSDWQRSLKIGFNNYNGHNVTAKTRGVNIDFVKKNYKNWPHISQAEAQMAEFVHRMRTAPRNYNRKNKSRQEEWLDAWAALSEDKKISLTDEQRLLNYGFKHAHQNAITAQGIRPTIMGNTYAYSVPPALYRQNNGKRVQVIYDPYDMGRVLITDNENLRFIASSMTPVAGCMADMQEGGRTLLNQILNEAKAESQYNIADAVRRQSVLRDNNIDVEGVLKLGVSVPKAIKQRAEEMKGLQAPVVTLNEPAEDAEYDVLNAILKRK